MPRAHRTFLSGQIWHITHRCHKKEFLLKFAKDRLRWCQWLYEAKKRYGLCVLNYIVTSNHIHLMVLDTGQQVIANSMQLIAGRTAQAYNRRKHRKGAYWEDRYHATAIQSDDHLAECIAYIDMNMVRAGVVKHPGEWPASGYSEINKMPKRYGIIDVKMLMSLLGIHQVTALQQARAEWVDALLGSNNDRRNPDWSESLAVGGLTFVADIKRQLGVVATSRKIEQVGEQYLLKEDALSYVAHFDAEKGGLSDNLMVLFDEY